MISRKEAEARVAAMRDEEWLGRAHELLAGLPADEREMVACALDTERHDRLWRKDAQRLPERLRSNKLSYDDLQQMGGRVLAELGGAQRLEVLERLVPGKAAHIEAGLKALPRRALHIEYRTRPARVARGERLTRARAEWLCEILTEIGPLGATVPELAGWLSHLDPSARDWGWLLAGVIDAGGPDGERVLSTLLATLRGDHETGAMHAAVIMALLACSRPEGWEAVSKLLLAAQRQEGLRQSILESVDEGHPGAFAHMCRVILEHGLCRFSSVVRAADVWFGLLWDSASGKVVEGAIESALGFLDGPEGRNKAVEKGKPVEAYFALWAAGFEDLGAMLPLAERALASGQALTRYAGVHALANIHVEEASPILLRALDDPDDRVAVRAMDHFAGWNRFSEQDERENDEGLWHDEAFAALERLWARFPGRRVKIAPALWPWTGRMLDTALIGSALAEHASERTMARLLPHLARLGPRDREAIAARLGARERGWGGEEWPAPDPAPIAASARQALIGLLGDPAPGPVGQALRSLYHRPIEQDEEGALHGLLRRTQAQVRTDALRRAIQMPDQRLLAFARALLEGVGEQRLAGLELLRTMVETKRSPEAARAVAADWAGQRTKTSSAERTALAALADAGIDRPRRDDAFGLINVANLARPGVARSLPQLRMSDAAWEGLASVALVIARHKDRELPRPPGERDQEPVLLGGEIYSWRVASPAPGTMEAERARCPYLDLVDAWRSERGPEKHDADGLELLRAWLACEFLTAKVGRGCYHDRPDWPKAVLERLKSSDPASLSVTSDMIKLFVEWSMRLASDGRSRAEVATVLIDSMEGAVASGCFRHRDHDDDDDDDDDEDGRRVRTERHAKPLREDIQEWSSALNALAEHGIAEIAPEHSVRRWRLAIAGRPAAESHWAGLSEKARKGFWSKHAGAVSLVPEYRDVLEGLHAGVATEDDVLDFATNSYWSEDGDVGWLTQSAASSDGEDESGGDEQASPYIHHRRAEAARTATLRSHAAFVSAAARLRTRLIELELARGDSPTEASPMTRRVAFAGGAEVCVRCLAGLGAQGFKRNPGYRDDSRQANLTHLVSVTHPEAGDTPERFAALARSASMGEAALIGLAVFAPQWVRHVEHALGKDWAGFEEAVWWIHAHTKDGEYRVDSAVRKTWQAAIAERTPLAPDELKDGAVDVAWFGRVLEALGEKRWAEVYAWAKLACGGAGHKRAQIFADAMLRRRGATERELMSRIRTKRHQDSIRALGLVPLKDGKGQAKARQAQVMTRYRLMQEVRRTSRKHGGSMLQASEKRAVEIGMENLARSAGFPDPLRLQWAMERLELADLAKGPVSARAGDVTVILRVTDEGVPEVSASRKGKPLANLPPAVRKDKKVAGLTARATELRRAGSRMRQALEQAMCRGDVFTAGEVAELWQHPILRTMLERLVVVGEGTTKIRGYPDRGGRVLRDHAGAIEPLRAGDALRIAHPHDFLTWKNWHAWQRECFGAERVQPFKQVFREVYVLTGPETGGTASARYEGQQVNPRQALAVLGARGWVARAEEGVQRTFHKERLTARLEFAESFYTPADVEGLTLRALEFTRAGTWDRVRLKDVPARVFSEAMRDLDLVVAVAHRGGVDPEASQSTVEMRAALVRETCALLQLKNAAVDGTRVRIKGELAEYSVHLGSASVQVLPGGHVWIVPVGAQHRGRLFLPFADDDPKTAEVVSKVLLLARDGEIQDPSVLEQIRRFQHA